MINQTYNFSHLTDILDKLLNESENKNNATIIIKSIITNGCLRDDYEIKEIFQRYFSK